MFQTRPAARVFEARIQFLRRIPGIHQGLEFGFQVHGLFPDAFNLA